MDPAIGAYLISLGGPGVIIAYLLWDRRGLVAEAKDCRAAHMADLKKYQTDITAALTTSAELMRANNGIQEKAGTSAALIAEAIREVTFRLGHLKELIERDDS